MIAPLVMAVLLAVSQHALAQGSQSCVGLHQKPSEGKRCCGVLVLRDGVCKMDCGFINEVPPPGKGCCSCCSGMVLRTACAGRPAVPRARCGATAR